MRTYRLPLLISFAVAATLEGCCPSVWLTVTKGDPAPREPMATPEIADEPIPIPPHLINRYDAFVVDDKPRRYPGGYPSTGLGPYTDALDAGLTGPDNGGAVTQARLREGARARTGLADGAGGQSAPPPTEGPPRQATFVDCDANSPCRTLKVAGSPGVDGPVSVTISSCTGSSVVRAIQSVRPCNGVLHSQGSIVDCACSEPETTYVTLTTPAPPAPCDPSMTVTFSAARDALAQTLFTFIHLSDIQIRDPDIRMGDVRLSHALDPIIQSFEYDHDMEFYNRYVVEALLATINKDVDRYDADVGNPDRPALVIHTGDAIDSGVTSELRDVHRLVDRLKIPFFDVIGNHDVLTFGNLLPSKTRDNDATCATAESAAAPVSATVKTPFFKKHILTGKLCVDDKISCPNCLPDEATLVAGQTHADSRETFIKGFRHKTINTAAQLPDQGDDKFICSIDTVRNSAVTLSHGFDLGPPSAQTIGYYAFERRLPPLPDRPTPRHLLVVALDTNDLRNGEGGSHGRIGPRQMAWLRNVLQCARDNPGTLVFLFGHHPISDVETDQAPRQLVQATGQLSELEQTLSANPSVVAYFYGHEHLHRICGDGRPTTCSRFWEIETGSVLEFPQEGRLVRLKYGGHGMAFLEIVAFKEQLANTNDDFAQAVALARTGAQRDYCQDPSHHVSCSADHRVYRTDGRHANGRLFFGIPPLPGEDP